MPLLDIDPGSLALAVRGRFPLRVQHRLVGDPRLTVEAAERVIADVPPHEIEHHLGDLPLLLPRGDAPALDLAPADVVRGIARNGCWVRVGALGSLAGWDQLLEDCLAGFDTTGARHAQVFLSSPGAVTPAHFDTYHNLLLQVEGRKDVSIGRFTDRRVARREIARRFRDQENLRALPTDVEVFRLEPGDGLYIPPYAFHWAHAGDGVSLALSCNFTDTWSERARTVEACNRRLRRLGLEPEPPGGSELRDRVKAAMVRSWRTARSRVTRSRSRSR